MQASSSGLTLDDIREYIAEEFGEDKPSRRTAERLRDGLLQIFPDMYEAETDERLKRWKIPNIAANRLINFSSEELTELELTRKVLLEKGLDARAKNVASLIDKLKPLTDKLSRIEPDLEALCEAEGFALRPSPRYKIDAEILSKLRYAIKACCKIAINYKGSSGKMSWQDIEPYGIIYGHKNYLVAWMDYNEDYCYFILSNIKKIKALDQSFERDDEFNLKEYASRSFGIWQDDEPLEVELKFTPEIKEDVENFYFHSSQELIPQSDGSTIVKFTACGDREICWHLFTWGSNVQILAPDKLKDLYKKMIEEVSESL
jgi:predicted DNA-binding transcriptional regulator YafY